MNDLTIVDVWEYYYRVDEFMLADLLQLREEGKIVLEHGRVSAEDLETIMKELRLPQMHDDSPDDVQAPEAPSAQDGELEARAKTLEKEIYDLERGQKGGRKKRKRKRTQPVDLDVLCEKYEELGACYARIAEYDEAARSKAVQYIKKLFRQDLSQEREARASLLLGGLLVEEGDAEEAIEMLERSERAYADMNARLSITRIRQRSEYTKQLGKVYTLLFKAQECVGKPSLGLLDKAQACFADASDKDVSQYIKELQKLRVKYHGG